MKGHIGFTGTQRGMTEKQKQELSQWLNILHKGGMTHFHHGDCVGADAEAHEIAYTLGYNISLHSPSDEKKRAFSGFTENRYGLYMRVTVWPAKPYLERNHDIVDACEEMIACPGEPDEVLRSGTWATIRYARKMGVRLIIIRP